MGSGWWGVDECGEGVKTGSPPPTVPTHHSHTLSSTIHHQAMPSHHHVHHSPPNATATATATRQLPPSLAVLVTHNRPRAVLSRGVSVVLRCLWGGEGMGKG